MVVFLIPSSNPISISHPYDFAVENKITKPLNLGSGVGYTIKEVVDLVVKHSGKDLEVKWLSDKPNGDQKRLFDMSTAKSYGWEIEIGLEDGIKKSTEWFLNNKSFCTILLFL